jgi:outer membrane protein assembly factor BamD
MILLILSGCGSSDEVTMIPVEERFTAAKALFDDEDYLAAINEFNIITVQHQGSAYADSAQFFLAECRFRRGEYLVAATEYAYLKRVFPASPLVPEAQYKMALSYYNLSPKSTLDQRDTKRAIDEFQSFVEYYPLHPHRADADAKIKELNTKLARKGFETAQLYQTMENYKSALYYFDDVIERFHDTEFAPLAYLGKVEVLITRERYEEARAALNRFYERFPHSVLRSRADRLKATVDKEIKSDSRISDTPADVFGSVRTQTLQKQGAGR